MNDLLQQVRDRFPGHSITLKEGVVHDDFMARTHLLVDDEIVVERWRPHNVSAETTEMACKLMDEMALKFMVEAVEKHLASKS